MKEKDYVLVASVISWIREINWAIENEQASTGVDVCDKIAGELASKFAIHDSNFKRGIFLKAAGIK